MTLHNFNKLDHLWENTQLRGHVMAVTIFTPKFLKLLDDALNLHPELSISIKALKKDCMHCLSYHDAYIEKNLQISPEILSLTDKLYWLYDDITLSSSIEEKIVAWKTAYTIAAKQYSRTSPVKVILQEPSADLHPNHAATDTEFEQDIFNSLEDLKAWYDIHFIDETPIYLTVVHDLTHILENLP